MKILLFLVILPISRGFERQTITASNGAPVGDISNSISSGPRGPLLLQDTILLDELATFNREQIPERVVHARGSGAFGYFEVTDDITRYTKAEVFSKIGKRTPILVRFSLARTDRGGAETTRDLFGFAVRFHTEEGNWDLVGNYIPTFFVRDSLFISNLAHVLKRNRVTNLPDATAFWDFMSLKPETTHSVLMLFSDRGIPDGFRHMDGYGGNTFKLVNANGEAVYCKFHFKTNQGIKNIPVDRAQQLQATDPNYDTRDLYDAILRGDYPSWTFYIQVMTFEQAEKWYFNPFDVTKVWPNSEFPLIEVGTIVLDRIPRNHFEDIEQAAFSPANFIPGIEASPDKNLQGRLFSYGDTHRHRLGRNFKQFPVNYPYRSPPRNYQQSSCLIAICNKDDKVNYFPNSYCGPTEDSRYKESCFKTSGDVRRWNSTEDNFTQPGMFYRNVLKEDEKERLISNIVQDLSQAEEFIQRRAVRNFYQVDPEFGKGVEDGLRQSRQQQQTESNNGSSKKTKEDKK